jgi:hypothetical protein
LEGSTEFGAAVSSHDSNLALIFDLNQIRFLASDHRFGWDKEWEEITFVVDPDLGV